MIPVPNTAALSDKLKQYLQFFFLAIAIGLFSTQAMAEKINLNQADELTLQYIPGIGPVKAVEIIALRNKTNGFAQFEELLAVKGIGEKTLETIKQYTSLDSGVGQLTQQMMDNPPSTTN